MSSYGGVLLHFMPFNSYITFYYNLTFLGVFWCIYLVHFVVIKPT